jgi:hypothetical protein
LREHLRGLNKSNLQEDLDKFSLKFYFKSNPSNPSSQADQKMAQELQKAALLAEQRKA